MGGIVKMALGLFGGGGASMMLPLILGGVMLAGGATGYFYIQSLRMELQVAAEVQGKLTDAIAAKDLVMKTFREDLERQQNINKNMTDQFAEEQKAKNELEQKFRRVQLLAEGAAKNPLVTETKLNRGTAYALRCNEISTGSPVIETDKSNTICQDIIKSRSDVK